VLVGSLVIFPYMEIIMEQLQLSIEQLERIGFTRVICEVRNQDDDTEEKIIYEIPCLNGVFSCDPDQDVYRWYHRTTVGVVQNGVSIDHARHPREVSNHISLNITEAPELFTILSAFKVKHTFFII